MKFKNTAVIFSLVLLFSIFNMGFVPAPGNLKYICEDGQIYDYIHGDGWCSTLDTFEDFQVEPPTLVSGFSYKLKSAFSSPETKVKLSAVLTSKQIAQLEQALEEGDYEKAEAVSENIRQTLQKSGRWLEEFNGEGMENVNYDEFISGEGEFNDFLYTKRMEIQNIEKLSKIEGTLLEKVNSGETTHVMVDGIFDALNNEGEVIAKFENKENEFVEQVAKNGGVTELEIEYALENEDKENGFTEHYYKNYDAQDYADTMARLDSLRTEIADSDREYSREVENLFGEARLRAQLSQSEIQNGHYSDGYNEFYKSQYIMYNLENYANEGERALNNIDESVVVGPVELNKEIVEENNQIIRDYELARNMLLEKYPDEVKNLDNSYIEAQDVVALSDKIDELADEELATLEEAGKTKEEAKEIIEDKKVEEYYYNYGGKYFPPQYVSVSTDDETKEINYDYGGGSVKRYDYYDLADDTDYRFGDNGYSWTTWTGEKYSAPHPSDYTPTPVKRGDEVYKTEVETADGNYNYEYYATGYKTIAPDGTETEKIYSDTADKMQFTGGAFVDYEPTGYVVTYKGEAQVWQGNPAFDNYINLADGKVFVPEVSPQKDATYKTEEKIYEDTYEGVKWTFDPVTKIWTNDATKQTVPTTPSDAPIGYEEEKEYTTEDGTEWTYEENAEKFAWHWKGADGIEGDYVPVPNNYYSYDDETGNYIDIEGGIKDEAEYNGEKWEVSNDVWISESGTTYNPKTGDTYVVVGDAVVLASELEDIESGGYYNYGRMYGADGKEVRSYTYNTGSYAWEPSTNSYGYYSEYGIPNYDVANPTKHELKDAEGNIITTWVQDKDGRWRVEGSAGDTGYFGYERYSNVEALAKVGKSVVGDDGRKYIVDAIKGWTDDKGNAVAPPMVGGMQQPSSDTGMRGGSYPGYYGGYYDSATKTYVGATGCSGGCSGDFGYGAGYYGGSYSNNLGSIQSADGTLRPATSQAEVDAARIAGNYIPPIGDPISTGYYTGGSTPLTPVGTNYQYIDPSSGKSNTYTKTAAGDWRDSYGVTVGTPPGYSTGSYPSAYTGSYPGGYGATTGTSGYYQNGAWVSTPSTNYGGNYASYYGSYAGSGAAVGITTVYNGQTYTVDAVKGWMNELGEAVEPPPGYASSATGYSGGTSYSSGGYYSGGTWVSSGGYTGGGGYNEAGVYVGGSYGNYDASGTYVPSGSYVGTYATGPTGYFGSDGAWVAPSSSSYTTGTYSGAYTVGAGTYDATTGTYTYGSQTYSGGTYDPSTGSYSTSAYPSSSGTYDSATGTYSGGTTYSSTGTYDSSTTSTSTSTDSGSTSTSTSTSTDSGSTAPTGGVISDSDNLSKGNWFRNFWKSLFG